MSKINSRKCCTNNEVCSRKRTFTSIAFDQNVSAESTIQAAESNDENLSNDSSKRLLKEPPTKCNPENATGSKHSLQISKSATELMKDISITEIPGIRGPIARNLFRRGYIHMYFLARDFIFKFEADEFRFQHWFKKNFTMHFVSADRADVIANRVVRFIIEILFDEADDLANFHAEFQNSRRHVRYKNNESSIIDSTTSKKIFKCTHNHHNDEIPTDKTDKDELKHINKCIHHNIDIQSIICNNENDMQNDDTD